jgi:hypothetical protein
MLLLFAALIWLRIPTLSLVGLMFALRLLVVALRLLLIGLAVIARRIGRLFAIAVTRLAGLALLFVAVIVVGFVAALLAAFRPVERRLALLAELILRGSDHAKIMLGVLVIILRRDVITRRLRVTGKLDVLLGYV